MSVNSDELSSSVILDKGEENEPKLSKMLHSKLEIDKNKQEILSILDKEIIGKNIEVHRLNETKLRSILKRSFEEEDLDMQSIERYLV